MQTKRKKLNDQLAGVTTVAAPNRQTKTKTKQNKQVFLEGVVGKIQLHNVPPE